MASLTQWTWVWVNSGCWWWTGRPGVLRFMVSQRVRHDWAAELNWLKFHSKVKVTQSWPTLCNPMDYTVHGILQARVLEWVAFPFSRGSPQSRDQTQVSCIAAGFPTSWATREVQEHRIGEPIPSPAGLPDPGIEPGFPALQADSLPTELPRKPH